MNEIQFEPEIQVDLKNLTEDEKVTLIIMTLKFNRTSKMKNGTLVCEFSDNETPEIMEALHKHQFQKSEGVYRLNDEQLRMLAETMNQNRKEKKTIRPNFSAKPRT